MTRWLAALLALVLVAAACGGDDGADGDGAGDGAAEAIDYEAIGLWDDGPCDAALEPLSVGLIATFASPVISLGDQALALDAAAEGFNARGGANGTCIEVHTCDDGANADQAIASAGVGRGRRPHDDQRPEHRRSGRGIGGDGRGGYPPGRRATSPTTTGATRTRTPSTPPGPGAPSCPPSP